MGGWLGWLAGWLRTVHCVGLTWGWGLGQGSQDSLARFLVAAGKTICSYLPAGWWARLAPCMAEQVTG